MAIRDEFGFIARIKSIFSDIDSNAIEGIGDDCAVIPLDDHNSLVITTDLLTEGVHFLKEAITPQELGRKALTVNLSDVAAMGARPVASLLSIALPKGYTGEWADQFMEGYQELSKEFSVALIGGDTTSSQSGITVNVVAIGRVANSNIKRRSGARSGDIVFVGAPLGESASGLADVLAGRLNTAHAHTHHNPTAQIREGQWLGARPEVHAMIDLSDGLASDLLHILQASHVSARIDLHRIPTSVDMEFAVGGGEDYKLLFTAAEDVCSELQSEYRKEFAGELYPIGRIVECGDAAPQIVWLEEGVVVEKDWHGFVHF